MAKTASELNRKVLQNIRTSKSDEFIKGNLSATTALGEIAVQMGTGSTEEEKRYNTGLWTLAADGEVAVRMPSEEWVMGQITSGASISVDNIIGAVDLNNDGTYKAKSGSNYLDTATTVEGEIAILDDKLYELSGVTGEIERVAAQGLNDLNDRINGLNKAADAQTGKIVTTVTEVSGSVSETKEYLKDITLSGYSKANATGDIADTDSVENALSKLENNIAAAQQATTVASADKSINVTTGVTGTDINVNIKSGEHVLAKDGAAGVYTNIKLSAVTPSSEVVKEEYVLYGTDNTVLGDHIKIYKDSHIVSIDYVESSQTLEYKYIDASGVTQTTDIDLSEMVLEAEFASGVTVDNHVVKGVVDPASEEDESNVPFLTVGADGFKVSGIKDAIDTKINKLDAGLSGKSADNHVEVRLAETDGVINGLEVLTTDVASASALTELSGSVIELSGVVESIVEGFDATVSGETAHIDVTVVEENGKLTSLTINENDIASASALTAEVNRATSAETQLDSVIGAVKGASEARTYSHTGTQYLDNNTTVKADVETLDDIIGVHTGETESAYNVTFTEQNNVAKSISDIRKDLDAFKSGLTLTAVDDDKYIATEVTTGATGTTLGVSAITMDITASTSSSSALADSYDVKQFAISDVKDNNSNGGSTRIAVVTEDDVKKLDVSNLTVDCGTF